MTWLNLIRFDRVVIQLSSVGYDSVEFDSVLYSSYSVKFGRV